MPASSKNTLNLEQLDAIHHKDGPLLIIAGAGTGKTTVITERIKYLILEKKVHPQNILALTFTEKASREMEERVDVALPYGYSQLWISTFHSFCDRVLRAECFHIGLDPGYTMMSEPQATLFLRKNLFKFDLHYFRPIGNPTKFLSGMLGHFSRLKDEDLSSEQYIEYASTLSKQKEIEPDEIAKTLELANAFKTYEDLKAKNGMMDYSDLISNTLKLFRTRKNILKEYQNRFTYILLDELQDTNFAQNELAILLAGERKNITVVGDDDQSIYAFRGSSVSNIMQFRTQFPKTKIIVLSKNYRSTQEILDKSYQLIQNNNPDRLEIKENVNKKLASMRKIKGAKVEFIYEDRVENEAEAVAKEILDLVSPNPPHPDPLLKGEGDLSQSSLSPRERARVRGTQVFQYKDIAILVRANNHSDAFIRSFERYKIPYQFLGPGQLFKQNEIKDLIAYLKVLDNYEDSVSLYRILSMDHFELNPRDIATLLLFARKRNICLFEAMESLSSTRHPELVSGSSLDSGQARMTDKENNNQSFLDPKTQEKITDLVTIIHRHMKAMQKDTAGQIMYYFLEDTGMLKNYMQTPSNFEERKAQNIARFFDKLKSFEVENEDASVQTVVEWIDLSMQMGESPLAANIDWTSENAVNILTVHSSKGLEFPIVFVVNLVSQRFPSRERREQIPIPEALIKEILPEGDFHLQEERRLFYVAMTRARDRLYLTAANYYGEGKRDKKLSQFVAEAVGIDAIEANKPKPQEPVGQLSFLDYIPDLNIQSAQLPTTNYQLLTTAPITYLSYSQIDTFLMCPLHYKARYILKLPTPQTAPLSFGNSIHLVLRDFYQQLLLGKKPEEINLKTLLKTNWVLEGYTSKQHQEFSFKRALQLLETYAKTQVELTSLPQALEFPFQFKLDRDGLPPLKIGGKIDRIDKKADGTIEIIDYKTGTNAPKEKDLKTNLQLNTYALAANLVNDPILSKKPEEVIISLCYLELDKKLSSTVTKEQLDFAKKELLEVADKISKSDFQCNGNVFCENCEFKMLCGAS